MSLISTQCDRAAISNPVTTRDLTAAQRRLVDVIKAYGGSDEDGAEYWPVVNDWVKDRGRAKALALRNINRTVAALERRGVVTIDEDGMFHLVERAA